MPEMQGDEFLAKARHVTDADAILLTGYADLKAVIGAVNKGRIMAYVPKPWDPAALTNMVAAAYQRRMLARELDTERALLRGLMDSTGDLISFKDLDGRFVRLNASKASSLGRPEVPGPQGARLRLARARRHDRRGGAPSHRSARTR